MGKWVIIDEGNCGMKSNDVDRPKVASDFVILSLNDLLLFPIIGLYGDDDDGNNNINIIDNDDVIYILKVILCDGQGEGANLHYNYSF